MIPNYFKTYELVPWRIYQLLGENARNLVDMGIVRDANRLRHWLGMPMQCNTKGPGGFDESGLRIYGQDHHSDTSRHSGNRGKCNNRSQALDLRGNWDVKAVHREILDNPMKYPSIRMIEIDVGWVHIDSDARGSSEVLCWSPKRGVVPTPVYRKELDG